MGASGYSKGSKNQNRRLGHTVHEVHDKLHFLLAIWLSWYPPVPPVPLFEGPTGSKPLRFFTSLLLYPRGGPPTWIYSVGLGILLGGLGVGMVCWSFPAVYPQYGHLRA